MEVTVKHANQLKTALVDYVLDTEEADVATALERFSAEQLAKTNSSSSNQQTLVIDRFVFEGDIDRETPIDRFIQIHPDLSGSDRQLLQRWQQRSFFGLFAITQVVSDGFEAMNWLTTQPYKILPGEPALQQELTRLQPGDILLTRISPLTETEWLITAPCTQLGRLGKPKLAVAIGNFKEQYKPFLYSDAPALLEEAWKSVERYHDRFLEFFGADEVTLSGYQLGKKLAEFQEALAKEQLAEAGIDENKSFADMAQDAGIEEDELEEMAETLGIDRKAMSAMLKQREAVAKMVTPKVELPPELKKAEQVTVLTHPRWGQMVLPQYMQFQSLLTTEDWQSVKGANALVNKFLEDPAVNAFVWQRLAEAYPNPLESVLQTVLNRPEFCLESDLNPLLREYKKPLEPELPEIASVPIHLHNLFQEALAEVQKSKKEKTKTPKKGFQKFLIA